MKVMNVPGPVSARDFIALSPFLVLASSDGEGRADASPRGDAPGFVVVLDDHTLLIPDRLGNKRVDSFANIVRLAGCGADLPGAGHQRNAARQTATATITREAPLLAPLEAQGKVPGVGLVVQCGRGVLPLWQGDDPVEDLGPVVAAYRAEEFPHPSDASSPNRRRPSPSMWRKSR